MMKKSMAMFAVLAVLIYGAAPTAQGQVIWDDEFDDGNPLTNTNGVGAGYSVFEFESGSDPADVTEANGVLTMPNDTLAAEDAGNNASWIATDATFATNGALSVTGTLTITDLLRMQTTEGQTARFFFGFPESPINPVWIDTFGDVLNATGNAGQHLEGIWVVFHGRYDYDALGGDAIPFFRNGLLVKVTGQGDGAEVTILEQWEWDPSVFVFDAMTSQNRPDRVQIDMNAPDLTAVLTTNNTGYELSFSSTGAGVVVPPDMSGTWAANGVTNNVNPAHAMVMKVGRFAQLAVDRLTVELEEFVPPDQGNKILSNVRPPFIDEGTTVILTGPEGTDHQWRKDGIDIGGETDRVLVLDSVTLLEAGVYTVQYDDETDGVIVSEPFDLVVSPEGTVPIAGWVGLAALLGAMGAGGSHYLRRRK